MRCRFGTSVPFKYAGICGIWQKRGTRNLKRNLRNLRNLTKLWHAESAAESAESEKCGMRNLTLEG